MTPVNSNSEKMYKWENESNFTLSGSEFALIINSIQAELSTPEATRIINLKASFDILTEKLKEAEKNNLVKVSELIP